MAPRSASSKTTPSENHRTRVAEKKRAVMRAKLVEATMQVMAERPGTIPVIDEVIRQAEVSRGTFYNYFTSLDEVLVAIGHDLSNHMTTEILPVYDTLTDPIQRYAVGFRLFLTRAAVDRSWAGFVVRVDAWQHTSLVANFISKDLKNGRAAGYFNFDSVDVATDFIMGAAARGIQALREGVSQPSAYISSSVRIALIAAGGDREKADAAVHFSANHLKSWVNGELEAIKPQWAENMKAKDIRMLLG